MADENDKLESIDYKQPLPVEKQDKLEPIDYKQPLTDAQIQESETIINTFKYIIGGMLGTLILYGMFLFIRSLYRNVQSDLMYTQNSYS